MAIVNDISPSRRYRVSMMSEDEERVEKIVDLPVTLPNNPATVEIWYHAYIPKGHLLIDIVPVEAVEDDMPTEEPEYVGIGDSLEYVGKDDPTEEAAVEGWERPTEESEEDDNGGTFIAGVENSPKGGY